MTPDPKAPAGAGPILIPWRSLLLAFAAVLALDLLLFLGRDPGGDGGAHAYPWWHVVPGSYGLFGLLGCWLIVRVSKFLGQVALQELDPAEGAGATERPEETDEAREGGEAEERR